MSSRQLVLVVCGVLGLVQAGCGGEASPALGDVDETGAALVRSLGAPSGLVATPATASVTLTWSAVSHSTGYRVFRSTTRGGSYDRIATVSTVSYQDTAVKAGATYWYEVAAANSSGRGATSSPVSATPTAATTTTPPATTPPVTTPPTTTPPTTTPPTTTPPVTTPPVTTPPVTAGAIWLPKPGTTWQWQLTGSLSTSLAVAMYDIDLFDNSAATIAALKAAGKKVVCYFSAGTSENWRSDFASFPAAALGSNVSGWPGERWLDTRSQGVRNVMLARLDLAAQKGCDGVEPDNVDGYTNKPGFPLTAATQLDYNRFLADAAHARSLSVGLKNDLDQVRDLQASFDWALVEECFQYNECNLATPFVTAGKAVFEVEYGSQSTASTICPKANALNIDALVKNLDLDAFRIACR